MTATTHPVTVDERCQQIITACLDRISTVTAHYGADVGNEMAASFAYAFARLHNFGGTIYPDGPMGLICHGFMTVGMVFFEDSEERTLSKVEQRHGGMLDHIDADWPRTGEWSLHS